MVYNPSPEQVFMRKHAQREKPISMAEDDVWIKIGRKYAASRPKPEEVLDFKDPRVQALIAADKERLAIRWREKGGEREIHERSGILEAMLWYNIEQQNWLGENAMTAIAAELDEKLRGCDFVVEFAENDEVNRVGLDVILSDNSKIVEGKWGEILHFTEVGAKNPDSTALQYFRSEAEPDVRGRIIIPRVIVGMDNAHYMGLVKDVAAGDNKKLADHPAKNLIVSEIMMQLEALLKQKRLHPDVRKNAQGVLEIIGSLEDEIARRNMEGDVVFNTLKRITSDRDFLLKWQSKR